MTQCNLGHRYDDAEYEFCPFCAHLDEDRPEPDIDVGDEDHVDVVPINTKTTEQKGSDIL